MRPDGSIAFANSAGVVWSIDRRGRACRVVSRRASVQDLEPDGQGRLLLLDGGGSVLRLESDGSLTRLHQLDPAWTPVAMSVTTEGAILVALYSSNSIVRLVPGQPATSVAGTGIQGFSGDGGLAIEAQLNGPVGVAAQPDGGFLVSEGGNNRVRRVAPDGMITTVAGTGQPGDSGDGGPATAARLWPGDIVAGRHGGFAVSSRRLRRVTREGVIRSVTGPSWSGFLADRVTDRRLRNGVDARSALNDPGRLAITGEDDYLVAGYRLRLLAAPSTRWLAAAIRATLGVRRRVAYTLTRPAEVALEVRSGLRYWTLRRPSEAGRGFFRLPKRIPDGVYQLRLSARGEDGQRVEREDAIVLGRRLRHAWRSP